jgi:hypothetical protein
VAELGALTIEDFTADGTDIFLNKLVSCRYQIWLEVTHWGNFRELAEFGAQPRLFGPSWYLIPNLPLPIFVFRLEVGCTECDKVAQSFLVGSKASYIAFQLENPGILGS